MTYLLGKLKVQTHFCNYKGAEIQEKHYGTSDFKTIRLSNIQTYRTVFVFQTILSKNCGSFFSGHPVLILIIIIHHYWHSFWLWFYNTPLLSFILAIIIIKHHYYHLFWLILYITTIIHSDYYYTPLLAFILIIIIHHYWHSFWLLRYNAPLL